MALERNNTALEFETMLRQHLARGGATVAACAGFDVDAASAYLEDALAGAARTAYEAHLAGCPTCRRHVIGLSRLSQSLAPTQPQAAPVTTKGAVWEQLKTTLAAWLDPAEWRWHWAPATAAAGAVVLAVLAGQLWRQPKLDGANMASAPLSAASHNQAPAASPTPAEMALNPADLALNKDGVPITTADARAAARQEVPEPEIGPRENALALNLSASAASARGATDFSLVLEQPAPAVTRVAERSQAPALPPPPAPVTGFIPTTLNDQTAFRFEPLPAPTLSAEPAAPQQVIAARISPPTNENPARRGNEKVKLQPGKPGWRERVLGFMPLSKTEAERKVPTEERNEDASKSMVVRINDKLFRFEQGVLIDQAYKPEMQWRLLKLTRGSREYEQVLAAEPQLKEFFARGPIVIVWGDKIYKVVGQ